MKIPHTRRSCRAGTHVPKSHLVSEFDRFYLFIYLSLRGPARTPESGLSGVPDCPCRCTRGGRCGRCAVRACAGRCARCVWGCGGWRARDRVSQDSVRARSRRAASEADSRSEPSLFFSRYDPIRPSIFTHQSRSSSLLKCPLLAHGRGAHCGQGMSCQSPLPALPHRIGAGSVGAAVPPCRATQPPAAVQPGAERFQCSSPSSSPAWLS